jgi:hypothetical protein
MGKLNGITGQSWLPFVGMYLSVKMTGMQGWANIHIREYEHEIFDHIQFIFIFANMNMNMEIRRVIRSNFRAVNIFMNIRNSARIFTNNSFIFGRQMYAYRTSSITVAYKVQTLTAPKKLLNLTVSAYAAAGCSAAELLCWRRYVFRSCCGTLPLGSFRTSRAFEKVSNLSM